MLVTLLALVPVTSGQGVVHRNIVIDPRPRFKIEPEYTEEARQAKIEGFVRIMCFVGKNGIPKNIVIMKPLDIGLDHNAFIALKKSTFWPGKTDGVVSDRPVAANFIFTLSRKHAMSVFEKAPGASNGVPNIQAIPAPPKH